MDKCPSAHKAQSPSVNYLTVIILPRVCLYMYVNVDRQTRLRNNSSPDTDRCNTFRPSHFGRTVGVKKKVKKEKKMRSGCAPNFHVSFIKLIMDRIPRERNTIDVRTFKRRGIKTCS